MTFLHLKSHKNTFCWMSLNFHLSEFSSWWKLCYKIFDNNISKSDVYSFSLLHISVVLNINLFHYCVLTLTSWLSGIYQVFLLLFFPLQWHIMWRIALKLCICFLFCFYPLIIASSDNSNHEFEISILMMWVCQIVIFHLHHFFYICESECFCKEVQFFILLFIYLSI